MDQIKSKSQEVAALLKTLGHPKRLLILCLLKTEEMSVGQLEEYCEIGQSQISQFLKRMEYEGLVKHRREANFIYYSIADQRVSKLIIQLENIFCK